MPLDFHRRLNSTPPLSLTSSYRPLPFVLTYGFALPSCSHPYHRSRRTTRLQLNPTSPVPPISTIFFPPASTTANSLLPPQYPQHRLLPRANDHRNVPHNRPMPTPLQFRHLHFHPHCVPTSPAAPPAVTSAFGRFPFNISQLHTCTLHSRLVLSIPSITNSNTHCVPTAPAISPTTASAP